MEEGSVDNNSFWRLTYN